MPRRQRARAYTRSTVSGQETTTTWSTAPTTTMWPRSSRHRRSCPTRLPSSRCRRVPTAPSSAEHRRPDQCHHPVRRQPLQRGPVGILDRQPVLFVGQPGEGQRPDRTCEVQPPPGWRRRRRPGAARQAVLLRAVSGGPAADRGAAEHNGPHSDTGRLPGAAECAARGRPTGIEPAGGPSKYRISPGRLRSEFKLPERLHDRGQWCADRNGANQSGHHRSEHLSQRPGARRLPVGQRRQHHGPLLAEQSKRRECGQQPAVRLAVRRQPNPDRHATLRPAARTSSRPGC